MDKTFVQKRMMEFALSSDKSMAEISKKMGREEGYVSGAAKGRFEPKLSDVLQFCEILKISPADFFSEEEPSLLDLELFTLIRQLFPRQKQMVKTLIQEIINLNRLQKQ